MDETPTANKAGIKQTVQETRQMEISDSQRR